MVVFPHTEDHQAIWSRLQSFYLFIFWGSVGERVGRGWSGGHVR